jgi:hypothetical protein
MLDSIVWAKGEKLTEKILSGKSDTNIRFEDLRNLLLNLGFEEKPNLQNDGSKAKAYQVRQIRGILRMYDFGED